MQKRAVVLFGALTLGIAMPVRAQKPAPPAAPEEELQAPAVDESAPESAEERSPRLIGEAEALAAGGMASAAEVKQLSRLLHELKEALEKKAELLETGQPTHEGDGPIDSAAGELEALSSEIAERAASVDTVPEAAVSQPKENVLAAFGSVLQDAAGVLERLQEIRTTLGSAKDEEPADAALSGAEPEPAEELEGEVSGSVTEEGRPVEGATVADPETGATAITDADGLFKLAGVPAGRLVALTATKAGKPLGVRRVFLTGGRAALADFGGAASATAGAVRLRPSVMRVRAAAGQATGLILGEVRDTRGRPASGAAVALHHLGVVRSDSRGRFAFLGVPAGAQRITVQLRGHQPKREAVRVAARARVDLRMRLSATPRPVPARVASRGPGATSTIDVERRPVPIRTTPKATVRATPTTPVRTTPSPRPAGTVRGHVVDAQTGRPVAGARLRLAGQGTVTDAAGVFRLPHLDAGSHRLVVQATGFAASERAVVVQAARDVVLTLPLTPLRARSVVARPVPR